MADMIVRKTDGTSEPFDRRKLINIIKKAYKSANEPCDTKLAGEIVDSLYIYDGIMCSSIRSQIEERLKERCEGAYAAYKAVKDKKKEIENFVENKKNFIYNYKKASNTANATVDDNSNVGSKNIGVLNAEIHKPDNIQISRSMVMDKLKELYPNFNPKNYVKDLNHHIIYKHDESSFAGAIAPYTYSAHEVVEALVDGKKLLVPFNLLYDIIDEDEICADEEKEVYVKVPQNAYVKDADNSWTRINRVIKKKRHRKLVRVHTSIGEDVVVTDNHPMIVDSENINNTVQAIDSLGQPQYKLGTKIAFKGKTTIDLGKIVSSSWCKICDTYVTALNESPVKRHIAVDKNLGFFIGLLLNKGDFFDLTFDNSYEPRIVAIFENLEEAKCLDNGIFTIFGTTSSVDRVGPKYRVTITNPIIVDLIMNYFKINFKRGEQVLPYNILEYNEEFARGCLLGLLESNVFVKDHHYMFMSPSRALTLQVEALVRYFGYKVDNDHRFIDSRGIAKGDSWEIVFRSENDVLDIHDADELDGINFDLGNYITEGESKIDAVDAIYSKSSFYLSNDYIYDITTESNTFCLNNILVHNCVSITMYPFLTNGIKGLGGLSAAPKNIDSFCGMFCNLIFAIAAQYAGAVAVSEFLLYFTYFCKKAFGDDFYEKAESFYAIGPKLRRLLDESHYWASSLAELKEHDFGSDELNALRDEIVVDATRPLNEKELEDYQRNIKINPDYSVKLGDGTRTIKSQIYQYWQQIIYTINQPAASRGMQSAFVNFSYFDRSFFDGMFGDFYFPDGTKPDWESLKWTEKEFMRWFNAERLRTILTFPVESFTLLYKDGEFADKEMYEFVCEEYARGHSFFTYISDTVDSLSSCCRLKNKIQTHEFNFTNGNIGIQTGSLSVITLNLSRIIQDWFKAENIEKFDSTLYPSLKKYLNKILERVYKYHTAYNELLWDMYNSNLLPVYKAGFIDLNKQYMTIGINGLNQAAEFLGIRCNDNPEYSEFCREIFSDIKEQNMAHKVSEGQHKLTFNTECVPAESLAIKNYNWDKEDSYWIPDNINLYASYIFEPYDKTLSVLDKLRMHGSNYIGDYLDGGSASHIQLDSHLSVEQYRYLIKYAAEVGCQYFTWNIPNCECDECGYIAKQPFDKCPRCGSTKVSLWDRVIGYLTKIKNWSDGRQKEQKQRVYTHVDNSEYID